MDTRLRSIVDKFTRPRRASVLEKDGRQSKIFIPNVLAGWPWARQINPHYTIVKKESDAWMISIRAFNPKAQDAFNRCDFDLLACLAFPKVRKEHARAGCDLAHLFFVIDEHSDRSTPTEVRKQKDTILDALRNPNTPRPKGEWVGGEMARQFWELTIRNATAVSQKRFIESMEEYLEGVVQEATDKQDRRVLDIQGHIELRRRTSGAKPAYSILELGFDIPDEVMSHPTIQEIILAGSDMAGLSNDIYSYNMEQSRGDDLHNIVTCVMNEYNTDVNGAMLWIEDYFIGCEERFHAALKALPQLEEPLNSQVKEYCDGIGQSVRAPTEWSFESERYFGNKGLQIKESRWISLLPKKVTTDIGPVHIDSSLL